MSTFLQSRKQHVRHILDVGGEPRQRKRHVQGFEGHIAGKPTQLYLGGISPKPAKLSG
jgi:hypothetical protein